MVSGSPPVAEGSDSKLEVTMSKPSPSWAGRPLGTDLSPWEDNHHFSLRWKELHRMCWIDVK